MKKLFQILAGPIAFALMMLIPFGGLDTTARGAIGLLLWMLLWWIMQPVAPAVTALLVSTPDQKKLIFLYPQISLPIIPAIAVY